MSFVRAQRLDALPPYLFIEIDRKRREAIAAGKDVINLGVGDPDRPTPDFIIRKMQEAMADAKNHRYPFDEGVPEFRQTVVEWFQKRFGVSLDWQTESITLIGSKEGIGHFPVAVVNPSDVVLVPQPGYPVYQASTILCGGSPFIMDLKEENGWLPDLDAIPADIARRASLMFLNYPNNPTSAVAPRAFYEKAVAFAKKHNIFIAQDAAYSEMYFDAKPMSILEIPGAKDVAIEFHSLSKTFNMTGWRLGFAVGNKDAIAALAKVKANMDSGQFNAIQWAGVEAIRNIDHPEIVALRNMYRERRDLLCDALGKIGLEVRKPQATFYVWAKCPKGMASMAFAQRLLEEVAVVVIPGAGFGKAAEGYFRCSLTIDTNRIREAADRIAKVKI